VDEKQQGEVKCFADGFRMWHRDRLLELYGRYLVYDLDRRREEWMAREGITCCKETS